jgi:hypothetical protein
VRRLPAGTWSLAIGVAMLVALHLAAPIMVAPLYDGVLVDDPYRYLQPPSGATGEPTSATSSNPLDAGASPQIFAATLENPPQAQLIADRGAFVVPAGTTAVKVAVSAVPPPAAPENGQIAGNVYRVTVTDQAGTALRVRAGTTLTVVLRAPCAVPDARIGTFTGSTWQLLSTLSGGLPDLYAANITSVGDFTVVVPPRAPVLATDCNAAASTSPGSVPISPADGGGGPDATLFAIIGIILGVALLAAYELWQRRRPASPPPPRPPSRRR